jgi:hypothetical protein
MSKPANHQNLNSSASAEWTAIEARCLSDMGHVRADRLPHRYV